MVTFTNLGLGGRGALKSDINVTPLVAILFVLLVNLGFYFPFHHGASGLLLPRATHTVDTPDPATHDVTVVVIASDSGVWLDGVLVRNNDLASRISKSLEGKEDKTVLFRGDEDAPYSSVMAAMDSLRKARIENISLIVRDEGGSSLVRNFR